AVQGAPDDDRGLGGRGALLAACGSGPVPQGRGGQGPREVLGGALWTRQGHPLLCGDHPRLPEDLGGDRGLLPEDPAGEAQDRYRPDSFRYGGEPLSTRALRPWTDLVKLHPDVEGGALTEAIFAIDLGAIASGDPNVPVVNRDPEAFFRATYLTSDLQKLLDEVLASLAGKSGYNRVLKLRTPFGGGKSHTLASLLHAARKREALDSIPEAKGFARPKNVAVAVFDGEKFDARNGKELEGGRTIRTMWGWLAWQIDPVKAYPLV